MPNYEMSGIRRAAALLIALGPEIASEIFSYLDEEIIEKVSGEIVKINGLTPEEREELIGQFILDLKRAKGGATGGEEKARDLLVRAFGREKAAEFLTKLTLVDVDRAFQFFKDADPEVIAAILSGEHLQTVAVTLSFLPPEISGKIMKIFPPALARQAAVRMAKTNAVNPEAVAQIALRLREKYRDEMKKADGMEPAGGAGRLADIISYMKSEDERKLMDYFDRALPEVSTKIRDTLFSFNSIGNLTNTEIRILIDEIKDDELIAVSLKGAGDEIRFKLLRNMSRNRATDIINRMDSMGPIRLSEVEKCRDEIVMKMRYLNDRGAISLKREGEIYID